MVTLALQNLRSVTADFDPWYAPKVQEMKADPLMVYFCDLRTRIEKQAHMPLTTELRFERMDSKDFPRLFGERPAGAVAQFVGDSDGASGWVVQSPDGHREKFYVEMPADVLTADFGLKDLPSEIAAGRSPALLAAEYLNKLDRLLAEAKQRFG
jgi:hypothetical protein